MIMSVCFFFLLFLLSFFLLFLLVATGEAAKGLCHVTNTPIPDDKIDIITRIAEVAHDPTSAIDPDTVSSLLKQAGVPLEPDEISAIQSMIESPTDPENILSISRMVFLPKTVPPTDDAHELYVNPTWNAHTVFKCLQSDGMTNCGQAAADYWYDDQYFRFILVYLYPFVFACVFSACISALLCYSLFYSSFWF